MLYRFGLFELDGDAGELRKNGRLVPLEPQPARVLRALLDRADSIVSRDDLRHATWGSETFVDFDRGLAYCLSQIRAALGDSAHNARFVQTIPRRGYRFIAPVRRLPGRIGSTEDEDHDTTASTTSSAPGTGARRHPAVRSLHWWAPGLLIAAAAAVGWLALDGSTTSAKTIVAVSIFDNETGLADLDRRVSGLSDLVVTHLAQIEPDRLGVVGNAAVLRRPRNIRDLRAVAEGVRADYVVLGQLQQAEPGFRFITHLIRLRDETHLKANRLEFADGELARLESSVVGEFERAVRNHILATDRSRTP